MRTGRRAVIGCLIVALLTSACSAPEDDGGQVSTSEVAPSRSASLDAADVSLSIPKDAVTSRGQVRLEATTKKAPSDGARLLAARTDLIRVRLSGTTLKGRARISRKVPESWGSNLVPVMVWQDGRGGWRWLPTTVKRKGGGRTAVARTGHFSDGFLGAFDVRKAAKEAGDDIAHFFSGRAGAPAPTCSGAADARDIVKVRSDSGDAVKWCLGVQDGSPVLKITNNRRTFAQVSVPISSRIVSSPGWGFSVNNLVRLVGQGIIEFAEAFPSDRQILLLETGKTVVIEVPAGGEGGAQISGSGVGFLLQVLVNAVDVYGTVASAAGLTATTNGERLLTLLGDGAGKREDWARATVDCLSSFTDNFTDDLSAPPSSADDVEKALKFAGECGSAIGAASVEASGSLAWLVSSATAAVASIVATIFSLVEQLFVSAREILDNITYLFGSKKDPVYDVVTTRRSTSSLLGTSWFVHGGTLEIRRDGTARSVGHGTCPDMYSTDWCNDVLELRATAVPGGLQLTLVKSYGENTSSGEILTAADGTPALGSYWIVKPYRGTYLTSELYEGSTKYTGSAGNGLGNPYLCRAGSADPLSLCGA